MARCLDSCEITEKSRRILSEAKMSDYWLFWLAIYLFSDYPLPNMVKYDILWLVKQMGGRSFL